MELPVIDVATVKANCSPGVQNYHVCGRCYVAGSQNVIRLILFAVVHGVREPAWMWQVFCHQNLILHLYDTKQNEKHPWTERIAKKKKKKKISTVWILDTGSDGNLMQFNMLKVLFPNTKPADLNTQTKKVLLHDKNNLYIPYIRICKVTITDKGITFLCSFFVVPGNGPELLEMLDCKSFQLQNINCDNIEADHNRGQINQQTNKTSPKQTKISHLMAKIIRNGIIFLQVEWWQLQN